VSSGGEKPGEGQEGARAPRRRHKRDGRALRPDAEQAGTPAEGGKKARGSRSEHPVLLGNGIHRQDGELCSADFGRQEGNRGAEEVADFRKTGTSWAEAV